MSPKNDLPEHDEEPFLLTVLPFAGLVLLLIIAVVWRVMPRNETKAETPDAVPSAIPRWESAPEQEIPVDAERDFALGPEDAPVTIVEYSDFECPYCRNAAADLKKILRKYDGHVRVVFKNYPLDTKCNDGISRSLHNFACEAALLARCAGKQDPELFWRMHDRIFELQKITSRAMAPLPEELGLSKKALDACIDGGAAMAEIQEDVEHAREIGVTGTPILFINGRRVADYRNRGPEKIVDHILSSSAE